MTSRFPDDVLVAVPVPSQSRKFFWPPQKDALNLTKHGEFLEARCPVPIPDLCLGKALMEEMLVLKIGDPPKVMDDLLLSIVDMKDDLRWPCNLLDPGKRMYLLFLRLRKVSKVI